MSQIISTPVQFHLCLLIFDHTQLFPSSWTDHTALLWLCTSGHDFLYLESLRYPLCPQPPPHLPAHLNSSLRIPIYPSRPNTNMFALWTLQACPANWLSTRYMDRMILHNQPTWSLWVPTMFQLTVLVPPRQAEHSGWGQSERARCDSEGQQHRPRRRGSTGVDPQRTGRLSVPHLQTLTLF